MCSSHVGLVGSFVTVNHWVGVCPRQGDLYYYSA